MLANVREVYTFEVIDPAVAPQFVDLCETTGNLDQKGP